MKTVIQRVSGASLKVNGKPVSETGRGLVVYLGVESGDEPACGEYLAGKIAKMRIFEDENGKMNVNPMDAGAASILLISQFTLFADCKSRRPGFSKAARPEKAIPLYEKVIALCREKGFEVQTGEFGADMLVASENDGPLTILLDTNEL